MVCSVVLTTRRKFSAKVNPGNGLEPSVRVIMAAKPGFGTAASEADVEQTRSASNWNRVVPGGPRVNWACRKWSRSDELMSMAKVPLAEKTCRPLISKAAVPWTKHAEGAGAQAARVRRHWQRLTV